MSDIIAKAMDEAFDDHSNDVWDYTPNFKEFKSGWEEGYEWLLIEMKINGDISEATMKKYADMLTK